MLVEEPVSSEAGNGRGIFLERGHLALDPVPRTNVISILDGDVIARGDLDRAVPGGSLACIFLTYVYYMFQIFRYNIRSVIAAPVIDNNDLPRRKRLREETIDRLREVFRAIVAPDDRAHGSSPHD